MASEVKISMTGIYLNMQRLIVLLVYVKRLSHSAGKLCMLLLKEGQVRRLQNGGKKEEKTIHNSSQSFLFLAMPSGLWDL